MIWPFFRKRRDRELDEEIQAHLAMANRDRIDRGETSNTARAEARREFGNVDAVKEATREVWGWTALERISQDLRYSFRGLMKNPLFALTAVVILGLGIGANTTVFSVVNFLLLHPLPFPAPQEIVHIRRINEFGSSSSFSVHDYLAIRAEQNAFSALALADSEVGGYNLISGGAPERVPGIRVSGQYFQMLGVSPVAGRLFANGDDIPGRPKLAVLGEGLWTRRFARSPAIIGQLINVGGEAYAVAGVAPQVTSAFEPADLYLCLPLPAVSVDRTNGFQAIGRIRPGLTRAQSESQINAIALREAKASTLTNMPRGVKLEELQEEIAGRVRPALRILFIAVAVVLLIACSNVANLVLAKGAARRREIAVMTALGAPRSRVVHRLLSESFLLAAAGGALGLLLAYLGIQALPVLPDNLPSIEAIHINFTALLFAAFAAGLSAVLSGIAPALQLSKINLTDALKQTSAQGGSARGGNRLRSLLVTLQVALSTVLLAGAMLLIRSFWNITSINPGFRSEHLLTMNIAIAPQRYADSERVAAYTTKIAANLERLPGVIAASSTTTLPTEGDFDFPVTAAGGKVAIDAWYRAIDPHFFSAMSIPVLRGRVFDETDKANSAPVVIVNANLARAAFPNQDALGKSVFIGRGYLTDPRELCLRTIVGVVGNTRDEGLAYPAPPAIYVPASQSPERITRIAVEKIPSRWVIRTAGDPLAMAAAIRRAVLEVDSTQPAAEIRSMDEVLSHSVASNRFNAVMLAAFAGLALVLAAIGVYGLMSYAVTLRTREIGLRIALGAGSWSLVRSLVLHGLKLCALGVASGLIVALALGRFLQSLLFGVPPNDVAAFAAVAGTLTAVMFLATYIPAARAASVDPMVALRED